MRCMSFRLRYCETLGWSLRYPVTNVRGFAAFVSLDLDGRAHNQGDCAGAWRKSWPLAKGGVRHVRPTSLDRPGDDGRCAGRSELGRPAHHAVGDRHQPLYLGCFGVYGLRDHLEVDPDPIASSLSLHVPDRFCRCFLRHGELRRDGAAPSLGPTGPLVPTTHGRQVKQHLVWIPLDRRILDGLLLELRAGVCDRLGRGMVRETPRLGHRGVLARHTCWV